MIFQGDLSNAYPELDLPSNAPDWARASGFRVSARCNFELLDPATLTFVFEKFYL